MQVHWLSWDLHIGHTILAGIYFNDIRFRNQTIIYELALQAPRFTSVLYDIAICTVLQASAPIFITLFSGSMHCLQLPYCEALHLSRIKCSGEELSI